MGFELRKTALDTGIVTTNGEAMLGFYRDLLGFPADDPITFPGMGTVNRLLVGDSTLRIFEVEGAAANSSPNDSIYASTGIRYLTLVWDDLDAVVAACEAAGNPPSREVAEIRPGVRATTIQDPDGNWIEFQGWSS